MTAPANYVETDPLPNHSTLKAQIQEDVKSAMRARDKERLAALRLITAAIKQKEIDDRVEVTDNDVIAVLDKMSKQRKDSFEQYNAAGRDDLAAQESFELQVIGAYLPDQLNEVELSQAIERAFNSVQPESARDMGKIMGVLRPDLQGRADMAEVSRRVKTKLSTLEAN